MPISETERQLFYECMNIPLATSVLHVDGAFGVGRKQVDYAITTARSEIDARLDALDGAPLARVQALLAEYLRISTDAVRIVPNGANEGVDRDASRQRALIRRNLRTLVPVFVAGGGADGIPLG